MKEGVIRVKQIGRFKEREKLGEGVRAVELWTWKGTSNRVNRPAPWSGSQPLRKKEEPKDSEGSPNQKRANIGKICL